MRTWGQKPIRAIRVLAVCGMVAMFGLPITPRTSAAQSFFVSAPDEPAAAAKEGKVLEAFRLTGPSPEIDGILDESVWATADSFDDMVQVDPDNNAAPTQRTMVQIAYDDRYLFVAVRAYDSEPSLIMDGLGRRDSSPPSDRILLSFDPRHDHQTAYIFDVNPSGVQADRFFFDDTQQNNDYSGVWDVGTRITDEGWFAEFRIPFSQMQFEVPPGEQSVWGFTIRRDIFRRGEVDRWVGLPRGEVGFVSRFGHLVFNEPLSPPRRVELQPFVFARREDTPLGDAGHSVNGGLDLRVGLGTSATLSATVNPDFGQVELDPAVLNLTVFETFFPERRSFFLEDSGVFRLPYGQFPLFHSRRIGQRPGRIPLEPGDEVIERPDQTTILGAAKVSGKAASWTYGALTALTAREHATVAAAVPDGQVGEAVSTVDRLIEPLTSYNVVRVQRDILGGSSNVGAIATATVRERIDDAFTGGVDYNLRWGQNRFDLDGHWVATRAPFADGPRTGYGGATNFNYFSRNLGVNGHFDHFSRDFRNTDLGFITSRVDKTALAGSVSFIRPDPWRFFRNLQGGVGANRVWKGDGLLLEQSVNVFTNFQFLNFWNTGLFLIRELRAFDDLDTRGGPPIVAPAATTADAFIGTDSRKSWQVTLGLNGTRNEEGGWNASVGPQLRLLPSANLQTSLGANYRFGRDVAQWITNRDVNGDGETDHVYGRLHQRVLDITARAIYAFHRDMTVEVFVQPFVAVGDFTDIRRLAEPSSFEFEPAAISFDPDFNRKSLRANVILRWEYIRGSTLFLVWNMSAQDESRPGVFSPLRDLGDAFGGDGPQVFMVKATYWLGL
jgi:hypothetical protein